MFQTILSTVINIHNGADIRIVPSNTTNTCWLAVSKFKKRKHWWKVSVVQWRWNNETKMREFVYASFITRCKGVKYGVIRSEFEAIDWDGTSTTLEKQMEVLHSRLVDARFHAITAKLERCRTGLAIITT